jgi:predicted phosphodiesterase
MKTLLITDMHGRSPVELVRQERKESGIEQAVFLGDYDTPEVLRDLRRLKIKKKFVIGNHDLHYAYGLEIDGPNMNMSWREYVRLWNQNPKERDFIKSAVSGERQSSGLILEDIFEKETKIAYCHGGIVNFETLDSTALEYVWQRMHSGETALMNFFRMIEKNYWIMFRGHDHCSAVTSLNKKPAKLEYSADRKIKLAKNKLHIASIGSFFYGDYAIFDPKTRVLEHKNTMHGNRLRGP